jgi:hypothetical protein
MVEKLISQRYYPLFGKSSYHNSQKFCEHLHEFDSNRILYQKFTNKAKLISEMFQELQHFTSDNSIRDILLLNYFETIVNNLLGVHHVNSFFQSCFDK